MINQYLTVPFLNHKIIAVLHCEKPYVALRPICEAAGIEWSAQYRRIMRDDVLKTCIAIMTIKAPGDTQRREHAFLPMDMLQGWLFGVSVSRVKPELREILTQYKRESFQVLHNYFTNGIAVRPNDLSQPTSAEEDAYYVSVLSEHLSEIISAWNHNIEPALLKLESPIAKRLHDRFSESSALLDKVDRRIRSRLAPGQKPRIN